ncbi:hypothetical protein MJ575_09160 [Klebsiella pneumoniae]|nr:hypothetical protein MJ575_09160 [Klebsiella pneumoniae]
MLFSAEIWIDRADFREEANKQQAFVLGKEVSALNAYVIKAERVGKMPKAIHTIFCTHDVTPRAKTWPTAARSKA